MEVLRNAKLLKDDDRLKRVYISADLTREQREAQASLRQRLNNLRRENPGVQYRIDYGNSKVNRLAESNQ